MKLEAAEVRQRLSTRPGWSEAGGKIEKKYRFKDFRQAMAFVNQVAELAEAADHHPDILIHYNQVTIQLWSWEHRGIIDLDFQLAGRFDDAYAALPHYGP